MAPSPSVSPSPSPPLKDSRRMDPTYVGPKKIEGAPSVRMKTRSSSQPDEGLPDPPLAPAPATGPPVDTPLPFLIAMPGKKGVERTSPQPQPEMKGVFFPNRSGRPVKKGANAHDSVHTKREKQYCTLCRNHDVQAPKKRHTCPFSLCNCLLCELQKKAQMTMRHQQRLWRHKKYMLRNSAIKSADGLMSNEERAQLCDMCRNHNELVIKKNHACPFNNCKCQFCTLTQRRRELMKHLQKVRRSKLITDTSSAVGLNAANETPTEMETTAFRNCPLGGEDDPAADCHDDGDNSSGCGTETAADQFTKMMLSEDASDEHASRGDRRALSPPPLILMNSIERNSSHSFHNVASVNSNNSDHYNANNSNNNSYNCYNNYTNYANDSNHYNAINAANSVSSSVYENPGSPPALWPMYEEESMSGFSQCDEEETVLQASTRLLNQAQNMSFNRYNQSFIVPESPHSSSSLEGQAFASYPVNHNDSNFSNGTEYTGNNGQACGQYGSGDGSWAPCGESSDSSTASFQGTYQNAYADPYQPLSKPSASIIQEERHVFNKRIPNHGHEHNGYANQHRNVVLNVNCNF